ncbi:cysteine proteinase inhibitor A-like [Andrographis paniculata]|uniref:cysteine proteinase inhibitor A-like n=1 Tax=Andrographis paniculata TaxID=175694 RepID=UPI0021E9036E|nr:cysteine proteinase inhibitor A-like [Andrographis paniculata]
MGDVKNGKLYVILLLVIFCVFCDAESGEMEIVGGQRNGSQNSAEIESIGRFAVQQHNDKQNAVLKLVRVVKAKEQVVAGKIYYLTLEAADGEKKNLYEAKVWVKPWMNFKQLQEFKPANDH